MISTLPFDAANRLAVSPVTTFNYDNLYRLESLTEPHPDADNRGHPYIDYRG